IVTDIIPESQRKKIINLFGEFDEMLSSYIRGQFFLILLLSLYYILFFHLISFDFALVLGLLSGVMIIIPFIGAIFSFLVVIIVGYFSFGLSYNLLYLTLIFIVGHTIEGYIFTPHIIGKKIGLHPILILISLLLGGNMFGIEGVIFALPVAGILKILFIHMLNYYKNTRLYRL
ncbi:MAG TPA: AI-2E family transporter, partial [Candidatus Megaira endosymbiont of Hartmannula sinica]|nr:AI-2E family transporter [Candidatus Megaera endosymbiont of Hartmannula sinica]